MRSRVAAKNRQASYVPSLQVVQMERKEGRMITIKKHIYYGIIAFVLVTSFLNGYNVGSSRSMQLVQTCVNTLEKATRR